MQDCGLGPHGTGGMEVCEAVPGVPLGRACRRECKKGQLLSKGWFCRKVPCGCQEKSNRWYQGEELSRAKGLETYLDQHLIALRWDRGRALTFKLGCD